MLKRKDGKEINPDTFIYTVSTFKLVKYNADMDAPVILVDADNRGVSDEFASKVREIDAKADVWQQPIGPVIGAHAGPGTVGIIFMTK